METQTMNLTTLGKLERLANKIEEQQLARLHKMGITYAGHEASAKVSIKPGKKYTKVDIGSSGAYMVDEEGNIYGIKAYGVIHMGHHYGTLDTIDQYYWGEYRAAKLGGINQ